MQMGRVKLKIKRLESSTNRLTTYSKRKNGLIKKANELSVLCDIDIVLLMFSPSGRPVMWKGRNSIIEGIIERFAELTPQERAKRKLESFDALKRSYRKSDHIVNVQDFFGSSYEKIGDLTIQANLLRTQLSEIQKRLSDWNNPDKIDSFELLEQMEDYMRELFDQIQTQKQFSAVGCTNQFQNGMHVPFSFGVEHQVRHLKEPNLLPKRCLFSRETELSAGNSFANVLGYFGTVEKEDIACTGQESGVLNELLGTESLRNELIGLRTGTLRNELTKTECLNNELMKTESLKNESSNGSDNFHSLQLQNGMHLPFSLGVEQVQQFSWIQNDNNQHMASPKESNLFPRRGTELLAGNSFGNYSGYFGTTEKPDIASIGQASGVLSELLRTESLMNELIGLKSETLRNNLTQNESLMNDLIKTESSSNKLIKSEFLTNELIKTEHLMNELIKTESLRKELIKAEPMRNELMNSKSLRNELINTKSLRLQLYGQDSYPPFNFSILPDNKFQPAQQTNLQQSIDDYCAEGNFEQPQSGYDSMHCNCASTSGPSSIATFDEYLYPQQHYSPDGHVS
ncbi:agamous-like MADS-box protein AGL30 isoform X4 [Camellia sinensis]|uniref:agamous-like MADS-box protein AGL30 isoform X4 n=1 Tax=Camellia sinensis TaxID=4442 RepID=UPI0010369766|nr:agamous-like MADS-box protein AGL30 isoform X4 [Camellia sinensis]